MTAAHDEWNQLLSSVHVWFIEPEAVAPESLEQRCASWLSSREREHRGRLRIDAVRHAYNMTRLLCRGTLARYTGIEPARWGFRANSYGKPAIAEPAGFPSLRFNLTHTDGLIGCAITRAGEIGLDAECISRAASVEEVMRYFLSEQERAALGAVVPARRAEWLVEAWVLKEAYLKARGVGISTAPQTVTIVRDPAGQALPPAGWQIALHRPTAEHIAAVALQPGVADADTIEVTWRRAEWLISALGA